MDKKIVANEEVEKLLNEYNEQVVSDDKHTYSEAWHNDYSDSSCCC